MRRKSVSPSLRLLWKSAASFPGVIFPGVALVFTVRTVSLAGSPVFWLDGRFFRFPGGYLSFRTAILGFAAPSFLPEPPSFFPKSHLREKAHHPSIRGRHLRSGARIFLREASSWRSGPPSSLVRLGMVERPAGIRGKWRKGGVSGPAGAPRGPGGAGGRGGAACPRPGAQG